MKEERFEKRKIGRRSNRKGKIFIYKAHEKYTHHQREYRENLALQRQKETARSERDKDFENLLPSVYLSRLREIEKENEKAVTMYVNLNREVLEEVASKIYKKENGKRSARIHAIRGI